MIVLVEGASDAAPVRAGAVGRGISLSRIDIRPMGGVTNARKALAAAYETTPEAQVIGLCDAGESGVVERALRERGQPVRDAGDLPAYGWFVCVRDLEEELIRALGPARTLAVIDDLGLTTKLRTLLGQPQWAGRPLEEALHRFCGWPPGARNCSRARWPLPSPPGRNPSRCGCCSTGSDRAIGRCARRARGRLDGYRREMPKTTKSGKPIEDELPSPVQRSSTRAQETFAKTYHSAMEQYDDEGRANATAYASLKRTHERVGDKWVAKKESGPSDERAEEGGLNDKESAGGVDANATKTHLLDVAKRLKIRGRTRMTKDELVEAIRKANDKANEKARER